MSLMPPESEEPTDFLKNPAVEVERFHRADDLDSSPMAHHHTVGSSPNQAAPGNHQHYYLKTYDWFALRTSVQSVPNTTWTDMVFPTVNKADRGVVIVGGKYVAPVTGWYSCLVCVSFAAAAAGGNRYARFMVRDKNGAAITRIAGRFRDQPGGGRSEFTYEGKVLMYAGESVAAQVYQDTGAALNLDYVNSGAGDLLAPCIYVSYHSPL